MNVCIINLTDPMICLLSAPCPPVLQVSPSSCINDQVMVSWTWVQDALNVTVNAISALGHSVGCTSANNNCTMQGLLCGQRYTVQGTSRGMWCNSTLSVPLSIVTGEGNTKDISW